jgi:hypothetical protein
VRGSNFSGTTKTKDVRSLRSAIFVQGDGGGMLVRGNSSYGRSTRRNFKTIPRLLVPQLSQQVSTRRWSHANGKIEQRLNQE